MTHPPATCELCGDTGLYSPSALPCPKGCEEFDIVESLKFIGSMSLDQDAARLSYQAAEYVSNLLAVLSEAEQREKDARAEAILEAAKTAVLTANHMTILPPSVRKFPEVGGIIAAKILELIDASDLAINQPGDQPHAVDKVEGGET